MRENLSQLVMVVGRVLPGGVSLLGTAFLINRTGYLATTAHVTEESDQNLVVILPQIDHLDEFQDTSALEVKYTKATIKMIDPLRDTCILEADLKCSDKLPLAGADDIAVGDEVAIVGFPHLDEDRRVITYQRTEVGAKITIPSGPLSVKHLVLNIQTRPGQSGSPILSVKDNCVVGILAGPYAPGKPGLSLGGIDPRTLHQTAHVISAEYLKEMLNG